MISAETTGYLNKLRFPDELEKLFREDYYHKFLGITRVALTLSLVLLAAFGILDVWAAPVNLYRVWFIRYGIICFTIGVALLLTFSPVFKRLMQPLTTLVILVATLGITAMSAICQPTEPAYSSYYVGAIMVVMAGYGFVPLRFSYATWAGLITVAGYEIVAIFYQHVLSAPMGWLTFLGNNFFFFSANIIGMFSAYFIERYTRLDFLQRRIIEAEKAHSESLLQKEAEEALRASEAHFRSLIENASDGIAILNATGVCTYISPAVERMLGWKPDEFIGQSFADFMHPDDVAYASQRVDSVHTYPHQFTPIEHRLRHKDGSWRIIESVGTLGSEGDIVTNFRDITERKCVEEELRRLNEELEQRVAERTAELQTALAESQRLTAILEATTDMVGMATLDGKMIYVNQAGRRMIGVSEDIDASELTFADFYPPSALELFASAILPTAMSEGVWSGEAAFRDRSGHEVPVSLVGIVHRAPDDSILNLSCVARDISEIKRAEAALQQAKDAAEAANRAKSTFLANMSHEIRTPMNAVIGMTGLLLHTSLDARQRDFVETIRTAGDSLLTIINDILDFSKIEAGKLELEHQPFDLHTCIESALDLLAPRAAEKGLDLAYLVGDNVPSGIIGDVTRLRQVLVNLLSNAIKFTERGEVFLAVELHTPGDEAQSAEHRTVSGDDSSVNPRCELHFAVRDTGIGIASEKRDRLFHAFSQVDPSTTREYGGTGLGLAISKRLSELMGGIMWVESAGLGYGTIFHFTIATRATAVPIRQHLQEPCSELSGKRALIVDDNATNRRILSLQIQTWGMQAQETALPSAALALLREDNRFDLGLIDMCMPEMDGVALAKEIRRLLPDAPFPLVMLTSLGRLDAAEEASAGLAAVLTKPVKPSQLYDVLVTLFAVEDSTNVIHEAHPSPANEGKLADQVPLRILLAEDVALNQKFALLALEDLGYRADVAANGLEVLQAVTRQPYDVILMDVQMPEMDGLDATRRIHELWASTEKRLPQPHRPHIIAMTANALQGDREICLEAGMDDYVSKPVYLEELRAALQRAGARQVSTVAPMQPELPVLRQSKPPDPPLLDQDMLNKVLSRRHGHRLVMLYVQEGTEFLSRLRAAVERGDAKGVRETAHTLKGSSRYVGAVQVATLSEALEKRGREQVLTDAGTLLAELESAFQSTCEALNVSDTTAG